MIIQLIFVLMVAAPAVAVLAAMSTRRSALAAAANLLASVIAFGASLALVPLVAAGSVTFWHQYVIVDPLAVWVDVCVAVVYLLASIYAVGYMPIDTDPSRLPRFYALFAGFALAMFFAPAMNNPGLYWIAIEMTTLVSTFLVGFERSPEGTEAAWKYIIIVSAGISLALLGTLLWYWAGTFVLGARYDMTWQVMQKAAPSTNHMIMGLGFLLILVGYGTKVGLAPMHTWLPDAHSQGPTPVSAMLSGALLNTAMVGIVRALFVAKAVGIGGFSHIGLIVLGTISLFVAALLIVRQVGVKRLMAYSSVEHMGIVALAFGFGGPLGIAAAMYHMLNHSLNKSLMFFGAGNAGHTFGTKRMTSIRQVLHVTPITGGIWLAGAIAITGAPPFALFLSEFLTLRAGVASGDIVPVVLMLVLLIVIFIGFLNHFRLMYFDAPKHDQSPHPPHRPGLWCSLPMWLAIVPLLALGLWWPHSLYRFFQLVAHAAASGAGR